MNALASLVSLSDRELVDSLDRVAEKDRALGAEIVAHLILVQERRIHLDWGYPSLFVYCTERLRFSEDCAYRRIQAARAAARCPQILEYLADGELTLSSVKLLAPHVEKPEGPELVEKARGKTKREVERLVAACFPDSNWFRDQLVRVRAIDGERYKLEVTVDAEFLELLERAVDLSEKARCAGGPAHLGLLGQAGAGCRGACRKPAAARRPARGAAQARAGAPGQPDHRRQGPSGQPRLQDKASAEDRRLL